MNNRIVKFVVFTFLAFYLPVILIWVNIIPFEYRFHILVAMAVIMAIYSFMAKYSLQDLGFSLTMSHSLYMAVGNSDTSVYTV